MAIKDVSKSYAEQAGITQNRAEKVLGDNLRYYVDKDFQEKANANGFVPDDKVLAVLAESLEGEDYLTGDLPVVEPNYSTEDVITGIKNYENNQSYDFNNSIIGGEALIGEASDKTGRDQIVREFYDQNYLINATDDDKALMEFARQAGILKETDQTAEDVKDGVIYLLTSNPIETVPQIVNGIAEEVHDIITDVGQYASDKYKPIEEKYIASNLAQRAGDFYEAGVLKGEGQVKTGVLGIEIVTSVVGAGKVVKVATDVAAKKAVEQASKKVDFVDTDSEMIGSIDVSMEPEANFAGNVGDVSDPSIGSITEHMVEASVKGKQIYGGHDSDNFYKILSEAGGEIKGSPDEIAPGIYEIKYTLPGKTYKNGSASKTVYDPEVYPNMNKLADAAAHKALTEYQLTGNVPDTVDVGGIKFKTPVVIKDGGELPIVPTVYPVGKAD
ncbi:CdiA family toxin C-terminal domain-containing protein [Marinomonas sp. THO17]|uniref:CdiA family toxin C-terminal domain-containing protein n=1 Tax=Marinomonas sp. THO17 TaxID=3149048 RepID=UPI00336C05BF